LIRPRHAQSLAQIRIRRRAVLQVPQIEPPIPHAEVEYQCRTEHMRDARHRVISLPSKTFLNYSHVCKGFRVRRICTLAAFFPEATLRLLAPAAA